MGEGEEGRYSPNDHKRAMILSALLGWVVVTAMQLGQGSWFQVLGFLPFAAIIGLPIAFFVAWVLVGPILWYVMRSPVTWTRAAAWGAGIAAILAAISIVIGRLNGYRISQDPTFNFWNGREDDGVLTPLGWKLLAQDTATFIAAGAAIGVLIRLIIGPGRNSS
jgi:hypothetical protein